MTGTIANLKTPAIVSLILVLPFVLLELRNQPLNSFPIVLFAFLWLLPLASFLIAMPLVRDAAARRQLAARPFGLLVRVVVVAAIAVVWFGVVRDQMPCFLGVPNCD
jgi:hypothetical protein